MLEIDVEGNKRWKVDSVLHRNGVLHRDDGPAFERTDGFKSWHRHGKLHREDGPALEFPDGTKYWYLNGKEFTKPEWFCELLKDRSLTTHQRELLDALNENWAGTPELLYETVTHLAE